MKLIPEIPFFNFINKINGESTATTIATDSATASTSTTPTIIEEYSETVIGNNDQHEKIVNIEKELTESIMINESSEVITLSNNVNSNSSSKKSRKKRKVNNNGVKNQSLEVEYRKGHFINSRGMKLVSQEWIPKNPKGVVIVVHGYGDNSQGSLRSDCEVIARNNFATFVYDQQGHGLSEGITCYVRDFEDLVEDSMLFISDITFRYPTLKRFIYCCSMGGAVGLCISLKKPEIFNGGLVLLAPLIKLDDNMVPNPMVISLLTWVSQSFPTLAIVPGENVLDRSIKDPIKRAEHATHPLTYKGRTRLGTGLAILRVTSYLQSNLENVTVPLCILHGELDRVSSPIVSEELFKKASSTDKHLKIYDNMWHSLTSEPESHLVFNDIVNWIDKRIEKIDINNNNNNNNNNNDQDTIGSSSF